jgi:hypothetical protein
MRYQKSISLIYCSAIAAVLQISHTDRAHAAGETKPGNKCDIAEQYAKKTDTDLRRMTIDNSLKLPAPIAQSDPSQDKQVLACQLLAYNYLVKPNEPHYNESNLQACFETGCNFDKTNKNENDMQWIIIDACIRDKDKEICKKWLSRFGKTGSSLIPKQPETAQAIKLGHKIGGGILIGVGIVSAVLGTVHIFHPIFKSDLTFDSKFSCAVDGVRTECVANQLGLGIPLIAVGGLSIGFGGAILHGRF